MSSILEKKENNVAELTITIPAKDFDAAMDKSFKKNVKNITLPGFRKGKAPRKLIEKTYGEAVFYDDAIDFVCQDAYTEAIREHSLEVVDSPSLEVKEIGTGKDLVLGVKVTVKPEVTLGEYKGIKLNEIVNNVTDEDVNKELEAKRNRAARLITVEDRAAKDGDITNIDFEGFTDGVAFPGGKGENYELTLGSGQFIPGFEEQIVGKKIGEEFEVNVTFPEEYHAEDLKGKAAVFKVKLNGIQYREIPELDDELVKDISEFDTVEELKADVLKKLTEAAERKTKTEKENAVIDAVVDGMTVDLPECMVEKRVEAIIYENNMRMSQQGFSFDKYLEYMGSTVEQFKEQMRPSAERQVKAALALEKMAELENVEISDEEFDAKLVEMAEAYGMEADSLRKNIHDHDKEDIIADMKNEKALEIAVSSAKWAKAKTTAKKTTAKAEKDETAEKPAAKKPAAKKTASKTKKADTEKKTEE